MPMELMMKLCTPLQCSVFKDCQWLGCFPFSCFPLKKIYLHILPCLRLNPRLNNKWGCRFIERKWCNLSSQIWKTKVEANAQILSWKILHQKLPVGDKLRFLSIQASLCPFCHRSENLKHIFWCCPRAKVKWNIIFLRFPSVFYHTLNWREAIFGLGLSKNVVADSMRQCILLHIWKSRCRAIFSN